MAETPIGGASLSSMVGSPSGGMEIVSRSPRGLGIPFGYEGGVGMGGIGMSSVVGRGGMRPGPGFGYPFRIPGPLAGSSSMAMP
jgi:hypothetical protein